MARFLVLTETLMDHQELKTCPFCGHLPDLSLRVYDTASSKTYGFSCCIEMETSTTDRDEAIAMWNTRVEPEAEGDAFKIADPDLHMLLNLSADMVLGHANQDTAMLWMEYLKRVNARLKPVDDTQAQEGNTALNYPDHEEADTERMVHTLRSAPTPEAAAFYASIEQLDDVKK